MLFIRLRKSWAEPELERRVSEDASFGFSGLSDPLREESVSDTECTTPPALAISSPNERRSLYSNGQLTCHLCMCILLLSGLCPHLCPPIIHNTHSKPSNQTIMIGYRVKGLQYNQ